jgi:hypothetical protein
LEVNSQKTKFGKYISVTSFTVTTFANTVNGERSADAINDKINDTVGDAKTMYSIALGLLVMGPWGAAFGYGMDAADVVSVFTNPDYSYELEAGDTVISTTYGGSKSWSMSRTGLSTTIVIYDINGNCKFKATY